jgi:uncharacterized protein YheU (UPF0270 family)
MTEPDLDARIAELREAQERGKARTVFSSSRNR